MTRSGNGYKYVRKMLCQLGRDTERSRLGSLGRRSCTTESRAIAHLDVFTRDSREHYRWCLYVRLEQADRDRNGSFASGGRDERVPNIRSNFEDLVLAVLRKAFNNYRNAFVGLYGHGKEAMSGWESEDARCARVMIR
jgi:hypothetical protein